MYPRYLLTLPPAAEQKAYINAVAIAAEVASSQVFDFTCGSQLADMLRRWLSTQLRSSSCEGGIYNSSVCFRMSGKDAFPVYQGKSCCLSPLPWILGYYLSPRSLAVFTYQPQVASTAQTYATVMARTSELWNFDFNCADTSQVDSVKNNAGDRQ